MAATDDDDDIDISEEWTSVDQRVIELRQGGRRASEVLRMLQFGEQMVDWVSTWSAATAATAATTHPAPLVWTDLLDVATAQQQHVQEALRQQVQQLQQEVTQGREQLRQLTSVLGQAQAQNAQLVEQAQKNNKDALVSSLRGKKAEREWMEQLRELFRGDFLIEDKTKTPHCGDFWVTDTEQCSVLIDVKSYQTGVSRREVDKFVKDVETCPVRGGILMNTSAVIYAHPHMSIDFVGAQMKPVVYLSHVDRRPEDVELAFRVIKSLDRTMKTVPNLSSATELQSRFQKVLDVCRSAATRSRELQHLRDHLTRVTEADEQAWSEVVSQVTGCLSALSSSSSS